MKKDRNVLIITYFWPPSGGPGVQRVLKFSKYLTDFGWQPIVLTVQSGDFPNYDYSLVKEIPVGLPVYKTKTIEPYNVFRFLTGRSKDSRIPTHVMGVKRKSSIGEKVSFWVRANVFVPDARIGWLPFAVFKGDEIIRKKKIDLLFSSGPPHTVHLIAQNLSKRFRIPWIADFRDPWVDIAYYEDFRRSYVSRKLDQYLEKKVLRNASAVVTVSQTMINSIFRPKVVNNYYLIPNGFDPEDVKNIEFNSSPKFRINYIGHLWKHHRPEVFFRSISQLIKKNIGFEKDLMMTFVGSLHDTAEEMIKSYNLSSYITRLGYLPHREAFTYMVNSEILYLPILHDRKYHLTGKLFEYIAARTFILGIGQPDGDAAKILKETKCGIMIDHTDFHLVQQLIEKRYEKWKVDSSSRAGKIDKIKMYDRRNLTKKLSEVFDIVHERNL
jgi:glycosyltransferase involved in cell wall biosynthesis